MRKRSFTAMTFALAACFAGLTVHAAEKVSVGEVGNASDAPVYIALEKGYFAQEGLDVSLVSFDSAAKMIAPLGTGELDVGGGASSAGLFNAASRQIDIRIVADRSRMAPGYRFMTLMIRKDLVDSGKFKSYADLKGLKIALASPSISPSTILDAAVRKGGLTFNDVEKVYLGYPQQVAAMTNKGIDGSIMIEPFASNLIAANVGSVFATTEEFFPNAQIALLYFGNKFATQRPELGRKFMKAYIHAARDYNDVIVNGKIGAGAKADEVVSIMAKHLGMKDEQIRGSYVNAVNPDGAPNIEAMRRDLDFFRAVGDVTDSNITVDKLLDLSFVDAVVKELGPYKPAK